MALEGDQALGLHRAVVAHPQRAVLLAQRDELARPAKIVVVVAHQVPAHGAAAAGVAGAGHAHALVLRQLAQAPLAGVEVVVDVLGDACNWLQRRFLTSVVKRRPSGEVQRSIRGPKDSSITQPSGVSNTSGSVALAKRLSRNTCPSGFQFRPSRDS